MKIGHIEAPPLSGCTCPYYSMYTKRGMLFPSAFPCVEDKVAPPLTNFVIYPFCFLTAYIGRHSPSYLAWKGRSLGHKKPGQSQANTFKKMEREILRSMWGAQHPNADQNIQHWPLFVLGKRLFFRFKKFPFDKVMGRSFLQFCKFFQNLRNFF